MRISTLAERASVVGRGERQPAGQDAQVAGAESARAQRHGQQLTPAYPDPDALGHGRLIDGGLTKKGAAEVMGCRRRPSRSGCRSSTSPTSSTRWSPAARSRVPTLVGMAKVSSGVIGDTDLVRELTVAVLERDYWHRQRRLAEERKPEGKPEAGTPEAERLKAERKADRERQRERAIRVRGANLDLGRKLLDQLAERDFSKDLAELFAYTILSRPVEGYWTEQAPGGVYTVAQLAARGLRYVLPDWQQEQQLKNGTTKVVRRPG